MKIWRLCLCVLPLLAGWAAAPPVFSQSAPPPRDATLKPPRASDTITSKPPAPPPDPQPGSTRRTLQQREPERRPEDPAPADASRAPETSSSATASPPPAPAASQPEPPATPAAAQTRRELLVTSVDVQEAELQRAWFTERGAQLLRRRTLSNLGWVMSIYRLAPGASPAEVATELRTNWPDAMAEQNLRHRALQGKATGAPMEYARKLAAWPAAPCAAVPRIAVLDGAIDTGLAAFRGRRLTVEKLLPRGVEPDYQHATALAALLLAHGAPGGLVPQAELLMGVIMATEEGEAYTTTEWIVRGLDWVAGLKPSPAVLNLSFGGPRSAQLARALAQVQERIPVVAAAGNDGRREPTYPAAYAGVVGVTAIDARARRWPNANSGEHVWIAAPGVEVWTLDSAGRGHYASGTSIAAVFVSAALAITRTEGTDLAAWTQRHTRDLGAPGRDADFGHGALVLNECP